VACQRRLFVAEAPKPTKTTTTPMASKLVIALVAGTCAGIVAVDYFQLGKSIQKSPKRRDSVMRAAGA